MLKAASEIHVLLDAISELEACMRDLAKLNETARTDVYALAIEKLAIARVECTRLDALALKLKGRLHS